MTDVIDFEKERLRRLQEHTAGACKPEALEDGNSIQKQDRGLEDDIQLKRKQEHLRKQLAERAASNMRIIRELSKGKSPGRPAG